MRRQDAQQRDEDRAQEQQEPLVAAHVDREGAERRDRRRRRDQRALRNAREQVLRRDRARVDVREGLVRLVHGEREQGEGGRGTSARDRGQDQLRMVRVDSARQHEDRAEPELEQGREQVAEPDPEERAPPVAREARVVRDERRPRDRDRDDRVHGEPEGAVVLAGLRPERAQVGPVEDPPGEVGDRGGDRPDRELADEAAHEPDRPHQRERRGERRRRAASTPRPLRTRRACRRAGRPRWRSRSARRSPSRGTARR